MNEDLAGEIARACGGELSYYHEHSNSVSIHARFDSDISAMVFLKEMDDYGGNLSHFTFEGSKIIASTTLR